jgi:riboflavin kinase/FMN adenylyltransferase
MTPLATTTPPAAVTVGTFDGVHRGHAALIARARERVGGPRGVRGAGRVVALVFDPHPLERLRPGHAPARLSTFEQRQAWLTAAGADVVERLEPTDEFLSHTPLEFVRWVVQRHAPSVWVEGADFRFGKGRAGDVALLANLGASLGFTAEVLAPVEVPLSDHTVVTASSTITRWLLRHGRVRDAVNVLGRPYTLVGEVVRGDRRGRTIGVPTANVLTPNALPLDGVYAGVARVGRPDDAREFAAAVSVGVRPMVDDRPTLEAHLIGAPRDGDSPAIAGLPEYGWPIEVELTSWLREQWKLPSLEALTAQIARDCADASRIFEHARGAGIVA